MGIPPLCHLRIPILPLQHQQLLQPQPLVLLPLYHPHPPNSAINRKSLLIHHWTPKPGLPMVTSQPTPLRNLPVPRPPINLLHLLPHFATLYLHHHPLSHPLFHLHLLVTPPWQSTLKDLPHPRSLPKLITSLLLRIPNHRSPCLLLQSPCPPTGLKLGLLQSNLEGFSAILSSKHCTHTL